MDMNGQAGRLFGEPAPSLASQAFEPSGLSRFLSQVSGGAQPLMGVLEVRQPDGGYRRLRAQAVVARRTGEELQFAVRLQERGEDSFSVLSRQVADLNREIASRRATQVRLEKALERNHALFRELQHRVKNHLQILLGLFAIARREEADAGKRAVVENLELKLRAICEAQQLMYLNSEDKDVPAHEMLHSMARFFQRLAGTSARILAEADEIRLANDAAFPLSLVLNELMSNAVKYAGPNCVIEVSLRRAESGIDLVVRDDGPGFTPVPPTRRSSGLGLVRGLCQQLNARLDIVNEGGTVVRIHVPQNG
jgi:two-component sensor histidine kinase